MIFPHCSLMEEEGDDLLLSGGGEFREKGEKKKWEQRGLPTFFLFPFLTSTRIVFLKFVFSGYILLAKFVKLMLQVYNYKI